MPELTNAKENYETAIPGIHTIIVGSCQKKRLSDLIDTIAEFGDFQIKSSRDENRNCHLVIGVDVQASVLEETEDQYRLVRSTADSMSKFAPNTARLFQRAAENKKQPPLELMRRMAMKLIIAIRKGVNPP